MSSVYTILRRNTSKKYRLGKLQRTKALAKTFTELGWELDAVIKNTPPDSPF